MAEQEPRRGASKSIDQLRALRRSVGVNQADLSEEMGKIYPSFRRETLSGIEFGSVGPPIGSEDFQMAYLLSLQSIITRRLAHVNQTLEDIRANKEALS